MTEPTKPPAGDYIEARTCMSCRATARGAELDRPLRHRAQCDGRGPYLEERVAVRGWVRDHSLWGVEADQGLLRAATRRDFLRNCALDIENAAAMYERATLIELGYLAALARELATDDDLPAAARKVVAEEMLATINGLEQGAEARLTGPWRRTAPLLPRRPLPPLPEEPGA